MAARFVFHAATAEGEGGIAVFELYGDGAREALGTLFRPRSGKLPRLGEVRLGTVTDGSGTVIDEGLLASRPRAASWCRLEGWTISCHGGSRVQRRLSRALVAAGGREEDREGVVAMARAGGLLDRFQGDALVLLPDTRTERAARYLLSMAAGALSARVRKAAAALERDGLAAVQGVLRTLLEASPAARNLLVPRRIQLLGRPNAGKSSLFNRLVERERAVVTPVAGTTRDLLEETAAIAGYPVVFIDSAGLRREDERVDPVEREGDRRARSAARDAALFLIDHPGPPRPEEAEPLSSLSRTELLVLRTKADLWEDHERATAPPEAGEAGWVSARTGEGLERLRETIREEWLGPEETVELEAAPFTEAQTRALSRLLECASIDDLRAGLLELCPDSKPTE